MPQSIEYLYTKSKEKLNPTGIGELYHRGMEENVEHNIIAAYVREARKAAGLTQEKLGEKLGMTKGNISGWERGRHHPSPTQLAKIAKISKRSLPIELAPVISYPGPLGSSGSAAREPFNLELETIPTKNLIEELASRLADQPEAELKFAVSNIEVLVSRAKQLRERKAG